MMDHPISDEVVRQAKQLIVIQVGTAAFLYIWYLIILNSKCVHSTAALYVTPPTPFLSLCTTQCWGRTILKGVTSGAPRD
jgi:hypothetical protein